MSTETTETEDADEMIPNWVGEAPTNYKDIRESFAVAMQSSGVDPNTINEIIHAADDAIAQNEEELTWEQDRPYIYTELKRGTEGVNVSLYEELPSGQVNVLDEAWYTWAEFTGIDTQDLPISKEGTVTLTPPDEISTRGEPTGEDPNGTVDIADGNFVKKYTNFGNADLTDEEWEIINTKVNEIFENQDLDIEQRDPFVVAVGNLPNYNDNLPYNVCEEFETELDLDIVAYSPRAWEFLDGTLAFHDGTLGHEKMGNTEFVVHVQEENLVAFWAA